MAIEIERKFLIKNDSWKTQVTETLVIKQGYLQSGLDVSQKSSVRIRISNEKANINIKSAELSTTRQEFEYAIPLEDAEQMLKTLCSDPVIEKTRYHVSHGTHLWEVDIFSGENIGLQMAEIELGVIDEQFEKPGWLGEEVSDDARYYNNSLIKEPYSQWRR